LEREERGSLRVAKVDSRPGVVAYTATRWAQIINPKKTPPGEVPASASDCYRFVLSNPEVDVCVCGPKGQMREGLRTLDLGTLSPNDLFFRKLERHQV
jgi:hypothetical protein